MLDAEIAARAEATRETHPDWPCKRGCDLCCRSLPHLPTVTAPEWARLEAAIAALPDELRAEVLAKIAAAPAKGPATCPLLAEDGACRVYDARPIACRTYGYYVERDAGLHCAHVTATVEALDGEPVLWGNGEAIADRMRAYGEPESLAVWVAGSIELGVRKADI